MLFKNDSRQIIILGNNFYSHVLAKKLCHKKDVIILAREKKIKKIKYSNTEDIVHKKIKVDLVTVFEEFSRDQDSLFIALSKVEEYNLFAAQLAGKMFANKTIALVYSGKYFNFKFNIDFIINIHQFLLKEIICRFNVNNIVSINELIPGKVDILKTNFNKKNHFKQATSQKSTHQKFRPIMVKNNNNIFIPSPGYKPEPGDYVYYIFKKNNLLWLKSLSTFWKKKQLFIIGANDFSLYFIKNTGNIFKKITVIEEKIEKCNKLASRIEDVLILHGKGSELDLFQNEGVNNKSLIMAVDRDDRHNLVTSFGCKHLKHDNILTLINKSGYRKISQLLDLESIIFLPELISQKILYFINNDKKNYFYNALPSELSIKNFRIKSQTSQIGDLPNFIDSTKNPVLAVKRNNEIFFPDKNVVFKNNDLLYLYQIKERYSQNES